MTERADIFIVGGGPAGLAAAILARAKGFSVVVADHAQPPIDKACGEGLMPDTVAALEDARHFIRRRGSSALPGDSLSREFHAHFGRSRLPCSLRVGGAPHGFARQAGPARR